MTRHYYSDPLAAAWMSKHFGMKFCDRSGLPVSADPSLWYMAERHYKTGSLFIHPDSLHLLEPQIGDVLYTAFLKGGVSIEEIMGEERQSQAPYLVGRGARIIQRKGKPFFRPEREGA